MTQLQVYKIDYTGGFNTKVTGAFIRQEITEWLIVTDHAMLKYKVCRNSGGDRVRVFTDVQAQGRQLDVGSVKRHDYYRRMHKAAGGSPLRTPELQAIRDFHHLMEVSGLEEIIAGDEKAQTAMMTAMGHNGDLTLQETMERAKAVTKAQREVALQEKTLVKAHEDELWGIF